MESIKKVVDYNNGRLKYGAYEITNKTSMEYLRANRLIEKAAKIAGNIWITCNRVIELNNISFRVELYIVNKHVKAIYLKPINNETGFVLDNMLESNVLDFHWGKIKLEKLVTPANTNETDKYLAIYYI